MPDFRQHDITDCGAACLAYIFHQHGLSTSISAIRQKVGTNRSGSTALGLVDSAKACGFEAKGVRCKFDDLGSIILPGIAHVLTEGNRLHYVVICSIGKKTMRVMDPAVGRVEKWPIDRFRASWTNVFIILTPTIEFVPSKSTDSAWSRLCALLAPQKFVLIQATVGVILGTLLSLSTAIFIQKIVDNVIVDGNRNLLRLIGFAMVSILVMRMLLGYFQSVLMLRSAQKIDAGLVLGYYRHLMRLPQSFFDTMRIGEITARVRDAVAVREFLNGTVLNLVLNPLILIAALIALFTYSWQLALFSLALVPLNAIIYFASDWLNRRYQREIMEKSADFDSHLVESLHAMSVVRSCGIEQEMIYRCETRLVRLLKRVWAAGKSGLFVSSAGSFVTQAYSIGLLWIGADLVLKSKLTAGELMSCNALAGYITGPIITIIGMNTGIRTATTATERLYEILDLERERDDGESELQINDKFELNIQRVNFRYPGRTATLKDIALRFESGTITALVGKSGCGKSTLLALLQRHYLQESGRILVGNVDIQYVSLASLRGNIAYVPQKIDLLAGTILENIVPNESQPDMARIVELCKRVGILEFIESLPRGFQMPITENGANLSGGQKQRLAIVRALYMDAPIVLMDEPASALDSASEDMLMDTLREMRARGKLVILSVHNRRLLSLCDRLIEMADGAVVAVRAPDPLIDFNSVQRSTVLAEIDGSLQEEKAIFGMVDEEATEETQAVFLNLKERSLGGALFGQTDANIMGINGDGKGWFLDEGKSDIHSVTGKQPGVYGFDICSLKDGWASTCGFLVPKIRDAFARGGLITVVWHPDNPIFGGNQNAGCGVENLLPGTPGHPELRARLDMIADNLGNLKDLKGQSIPIVFRCWHQQNGDQFWWGRSRCTKEEYVQLFRFTISYLRDHRRIRNFIYTFAVLDGGEPFASSIDRYPGDDFVDAIGIDWFGDSSIQRRRRLVAFTADAIRFAEQRGKLAALTEIGFDRGPNERGLAHCKETEWLRDGLVGPIKDHPVASRIAFFAFWRNEGYNPSVYSLPPPGTPHADCLADIAEDSFLIFNDRTDGLYRREKAELRVREGVAV